MSFCVKCFVLCVVILCIAMTLWLVMMPDEFRKGIYPQFYKETQYLVEDIYNIKIKLDKIEYKTTKNWAILEWIKGQCIDENNL